MNLIPRIETRTVERKVVHYDEVEETVGYTLELSVQDAEDLFRIGYHIGGDPVTSPRRVFEKLNEQFREQGVARTPDEPLHSMRF